MVLSSFTLNSKLLCFSCVLLFCSIVRICGFMYLLTFLLSIFLSLICFFYSHTVYYLFLFLLLLLFFLCYLVLYSFTCGAFIRPVCFICFQSFEIDSPQLEITLNVLYK